MEKEWQDVLDKFHYGIYLITVSSAEGYNGMIASWVTQCSHVPPLIAVTIRKNRLSHELIIKSGKFCINVLPRESGTIVKQLKSTDWKNKSDAFKYVLSPNGMPVLDNCIGYLDCSLENIVNTGDHTLFIGRITSGAIQDQDANKKEALSTADYDGVYRGTK